MPRNRPCVTNFNCLLQVLPIFRAQHSFMLQDESCFYFLQHENALRSGDEKNAQQTVATSNATSTERQATRQYRL